jgi:membrane glycosyltransferase
MSSTPLPEPCERYLDQLPLMPEQRRELLRQASACGKAHPRNAMHDLHRVMAGDIEDSENPAYDTVQQRLDYSYGGPRQGRPELTRRDVQGRVRLNSTPPLNRASMAPCAWPLAPMFRRFRSATGRVRPEQGGPQAEETCAVSPDPRGRWHRAGTVRRVVLLALTIGQTALATYFMLGVLPYHGAQPLELGLLVLFAILFGWVSAGFWTAMMGFLVLLIGDDRYSISRHAAGKGPIDPKARTAIVMPICNEDVARVFAGLRATFLSLEQTGELKHFDFFVLSDSGDPDTRVAETEAWLELCQELGAFGQLFYRWRQHRIKRKSGNVADFCRRWGRNYRYMVVLDADSVMSGECLASLVRLMEANPNAGIIQTAPRAAGRETLYARVQQFAGRVYGPLFTAGLHYWQLGESHYWGHNAIIRVAPFIRHCALGRLPGRGALSGEILSHDFVEAALMRRAGWAVWIAYDLPGSYEEMPPNLIDELKRDRRWCAGNLINSRLFLAEGLHPAHRAVFMTGVMAYLSAPLWFLFLLLSTALLAVHTLVPPTYFVTPGQLFPVWPEWRLEWALTLFSATATLLFLPKILAVVLICAKGAGAYGSRLGLAFGMLAEMLFSAMLAPIRMLFHTQFVLAALTGIAVQWKSPPREDAETSWGEAFRRHGAHTLLGVAWAGGVYWLHPSFLWWLLPVVGALLLSIPISVYTSRVSLGRKLRAAEVFLIPEESSPPAELSEMAAAVRRSVSYPGFVQAVIDPVTNALVCASAVARFHLPGPVRAERAELIQFACASGPEGLSARQKTTLISDPLAMSRLHFEVWTSSSVHSSWREALSETAPAKVVRMPIVPGAGESDAARRRGRRHQGAPRFVTDAVRDAQPRRDAPERSPR